MSVRRSLILPEALELKAACPPCAEWSLALKSRIVELVMAKNPYLTVVTALKYYTENARRAVEAALSGNPVPVKLSRDEFVAAVVVLSLAKYGVVSRLGKTELLEELARADLARTYTAVEAALTTLNTLVPAPLEEELA